MYRRWGKQQSTERSDYGLNRESMYQYLTYPQDGYDEGLEERPELQIINKHSTEGSRLKNLKSTTWVSMLS